MFFFNFPISSNLSPFVERDHLPFFKLTVMDNMIMPLSPFTPLNNVQFQRRFLGWIEQKDLNKYRFLLLHQILCLKAS